MFDLSAPLKAGLTQTELAEVLGVSRVTLNLWLHGKMNPHRLHRDTVVERLAHLQRAIDQNLIPKKIRRASRMSALLQAVEQAKEYA